MISLAEHLYRFAETYVVVSAAGVVIFGFTFAYFFLTRHCDWSALQNRSGEEK